MVGKSYSILKIFSLVVLVKKKSADLLKRMALPSSAEGEPVPFRIAGISFDAEGTLVCYHTLTKQTMGFSLTRCTFNQQTGVTPVPVPQWESDAERACYNEQWRSFKSPLHSSLRKRAQNGTNRTVRIEILLSLDDRRSVLFYRQVVQRTLPLAVSRSTTTTLLTS